MFLFVFSYTYRGRYNWISSYQFYSYGLNGLILDRGLLQLSRQLSCTDPTMYYLRFMATRHNSDISNETRYFLEVIDEKFQWSDMSNAIIMNVYCDNLRIEFCDLLIKLFPKVKKIITIDKKSVTINYIKLESGLPQRHYSHGDIENWSTLKEWEGKISKLVSNQCFHQVKDYKTCFQNVFKLLKPGGEAAIFFCLQPGYVGWHCKMIGDPGSEKYFDGKLPEMPSTQFTDIMASYYETMLQKIGFSVITCESEARFIPFERDDDISLALTSLKMPEACIEIFKRDAYDTLKKCFPHNPLKPGTISFFLTVILRKPEH
ncbi:methyltransf_25 domain-containing protein [Caerostris extrusa]|uniref:Methyltransf_25 domain-containing protein n=1 Tax=Caerostris extrusa TaxID=172846 RepID=A0AAV4U680_CAEEX|nr:methyltransf_25 domain-containing protein [Caerostris extrusa]